MLEVILVSYSRGGRSFSREGACLCGSLGEKKGSHRRVSSPEVSAFKEENEDDHIIAMMLILVAITTLVAM